MSNNVENRILDMFVGALVGTLAYALWQERHARREEYPTAGTVYLRKHLGLAEVPPDLREELEMWDSLSDDALANFEEGLADWDDYEQDDLISHGAG